MSHLWEKYKIQREIHHKNTWPNSLGGKKWDFSHCCSLRGNIELEAVTAVTQRFWSWARVDSLEYYCCSRWNRSHGFGLT